MVLLLALISGVLLATVKEIRTEPVIIAAPLLLIYLMIPKAAMKMRSLAAGLFVCALLITSSLWGRYWDSKLEEATEVVASVGGHVLPEGIRQAHHELWHPIWCGLGDFGTDRGFKWLDTAAYAQVIPILRQDFGMTVNWSGGYFLDDYYDEAQVYRKKISEIPEYHQVIKGIVQDTTPTFSGSASTEFSRTRHRFESALEHSRFWRSPITARWPFWCCSGPFGGGAGRRPSSSC